MLLRRISAPALPPVTLARAKAHCRIDSAEEDAEVLSFLATATQQVSEMTGRVLGVETWAASFARIDGDLILPKSPVRSITSIAYFDPQDVAQTAEISDFYLFSGEDRSVLRPKPGKTWPSTSKREDAVTVTFVAGYEAVPEGLKQAILMLVGHYDQNRQATGPVLREIPMAVADLVAVHRLGWAGA